MTDTIREYEKEHALEAADAMLEDFFRLPLHVREAFALILCELAKQYRGYQ